MPVALRPPLGGGRLPMLGEPAGPQNTPLTEGPTYARTRLMSRWHRVRSGYRRAGTDNDTWFFWCGQFTWSDRAAGLDEIPDGLPVCGTCEGRAQGADPDEPGLLFSPWDLTPPRVCPGSGDTGYAPASRWWVQLADRVGRCLVCQNLEPIRCGGGPYRGWVGLRSHPPGDQLVPGCPFHAWKHLTRFGDTITCRCKEAP